MRRLMVIVVRCLALAIVVAAFFGVPNCWAGVKAQGLLWGVLATFLLGRFFCEAICPLGILQSVVNFIFHPRTHVRRVCSRLPETKAQRIVRWSVFGGAVALGAAGCMGLVTCILPISIFGKALAVVREAVAETASLEPAAATPEARLFAVVAIAGFALVMVLAAFGKGRVWCNWICPFGTVFNLVAKVSLRKDKVGAGCAHCRKCMEKGKREEVRGKREESGVGRREAMQGVAVLAVAEKLTDGGLAGVSLPGLPARKVPVLPPGAGSSRAFHLKCVACQLCVVNCPGGCLKPSVRLGSFGQPELDFRAGACISTCVKCGEVCPEGAIEKLASAARRHVHMGRAVWRKDLCIRTTEKTECTACSRKCPVQAIHLVKGIPVVDQDACIGCGACEHVCPARPEPAIVVEGLEVQRIVRPMTSADALAERADPVDGSFGLPC